MDTKKLVAALHPLERKTLPALKENKDFSAIVKATQLQEVEVMRALQWMENKKIIKLNQELTEVVLLNKKEFIKDGLPEKRFLKAAEKHKKLEDIQKAAKLSSQEANACIGLLRKKAAIDIKKDKGLVITLTYNGEKLINKESLEEQFLKNTFPIELDKLKPEEKLALDNLKNRSILKIDKIKHITVELTSMGKDLLKEKMTDNVIERLTTDMLKSGSWKKKEFRRYNVLIDVPKQSGGKIHFVNQSIDYIKRIWLEMGFTEMNGRLVDTSYWDLDALFVPQDHPARAMQDTFYLSKNGQILKGKLPKEYKKVKDTHETGGKTGSTGWGGKWCEETAKEVLLRTHTTVLSARAIASLKKDGLPGKYFAVGKVFRNEALDWKHLFEFYQVEGIVIDKNANFKHLRGYLKEFYKKMGYKDVRLRPAHFPYTDRKSVV